ncbi:MAG: hypothetical protein AB7I30_22490, partial [Isosphaeraceae bacterium]
MRPPGAPRVIVTVLNFGREPAKEVLDLSAIPGVPVASIRGASAVDALTGEADGEVASGGRLDVNMEAFAGKTLVIDQESIPLGNGREERPNETEP